jgi:signal transduction histidine kinase
MVDLSKLSKQELLIEIAALHNREQRLKQSIQQLNETLSAQARELTAANRELHELSYAISHDLRAPLRAVNGFAQIIDRRYRDELNDEARHYLNNILEASSRMEQLIDDLLTYSRLGRTITQMEPVDLGWVLNRAAETFSSPIQALGGELKLPEATPEIQGQPSLLERVFVNLFDNGLKYRRPAIPPRIEVAVRQEGDLAVVSVQDNGIGIPKEHQADIFDVFHRLHPPEAYPGTGIGLAIIRKSLELMGGAVSVDSTPGEGSVFHIKLPLADKKRYNEG